MIGCYQDMVSYIEGIPKVVKKNTMADTKAFYRHLNMPGAACKVIHVAGTNGKGSVCAFLDSILRQAGYRVGLFTSPHLVDTRERIRVNGVEIPEDAFVQIGNQIRDCEYQPSYFEFLYFLGMIWFEQQQVDFIILETGLGGRLDATNSYPNPVLSVITSIGMDHMEYLGDTPALIAREKAGIMKPGVPVVCLEGMAAVNQVFEQTAKQVNTTISFVKKSEIHMNFLREEGIDFSYDGGYYDCKEFHINMCGAYQCENAALAIRSAYVLQSLKVADITVSNLQNGLNKAFWQGRMELIRERFYLDGAHNPEGIDAFLETLRYIPVEGSRWLMYSVVSDKDYSQMAEKITEAELFDQIILTPLETSRGVSLDQIKACFEAALKGRERQPVISAFSSVKEGYQFLSGQLEEHKPDKAFAVGSLYLAGQIKGLF